MKRAFTILLSVALIGVGAWTAHSQEEMTHVDTAGFADPMRPPARFEHDAHNDAAGIEDCAVCHHVYDDSGHRMTEESNEGTPCADCHGDRPVELSRRYHQACKQCHLQQNAGPVMCGQCHRRQ